MSYARIAADFLEGSAERELTALIDGWKQRHGALVFKDRKTRVQAGKDRRGYTTSSLVETVDVNFEDSKAGRLVRTDYGKWNIERNPDAQPEPVDPDDPMVNSPAVLNQCPNLLESLRPNRNEGDDE